jgi:hypothetical protein
MAAAAGVGRPPAPLPPPRFLAAVAGAAAPGQAGLAPRRTAPFAGLVWRGERASVLVEGGWADLLAIDGQPLAAVIAHARQSYPAPPDLWRKRIAEDIVEVLTGMGRPPAAQVALQIQRPGQAEETVLAGMTLENRARIIGANARPPSAHPVVDRFARISPFTGLVFQGESIQVQLAADGPWYRLLAMQAVTTERLIAVARQRFGGEWAKRIAEDPVETLTAALDRSPPPAVDLVLEEQDSGRRVTLTGVAMTEENRRRVQASWR